MRPISVQLLWPGPWLTTASWGQSMHWNDVTPVPPALLTFQEHPQVHRAPCVAPWAPVLLLTAFSLSST